MRCQDGRYTAAHSSICLISFDSSLPPYYDSLFLVGGYWNTLYFSVVDLRFKFFSTSLPGSGKRIYGPTNFFETYQHLYSKEEGRSDDFTIENIRLMFHTRPKQLLALYLKHRPGTPYRRLMAACIAQRDYAQAETVRYEWMSILNVLQAYDQSGVIEAEFRMLSNIKGLADPELMLLRSAYLRAIEKEDWDNAFKVRRLIKEEEGDIQGHNWQPKPSLQDEINRLGRFPLADKLYSPIAKTFHTLASGDYAGSANILFERRRKIEEEQAATTEAVAAAASHAGVSSASGNATTNVNMSVPERMRIEIQQVPRYGFLDFGNAVSLMAERPMSSEVQGGLKLLDILTGR